MKKFLLLLMTCAMAIGLYAQQPCPGTPTVTDHEGNVYNTVKIGNQCWTKENLRTTTSPSTGTYLIPAVSTGYTYSGKQARWYNNDSATYAPMNYGLLYNWNAAVDTFNTDYGETSVETNAGRAMYLEFDGYRRGICPAGWHLPSHAEWNIMEATQTSDIFLESPGWHGDHAGRLAGSDNWTRSPSDCYGSPGDYNYADRNASGFSAVPAGERIDSSFMGEYSYAYFWTSDLYYIDGEGYYAHYGEAMGRILLFSSVRVCRYNGDMYYGYSVRCLRNPVPVVATGAVLGVTSTTATCSGEVLDDGGYSVTARGVCWSTSHNPTTADAHTSNGSDVGSFTSSLTSLTPGTIYYVRAYATNSEGTAYGEEVSFFTPNPPCPGITTVTDYDGNVYNTVKIGNQCWMKENMRTTHFADGDSIPSGDWNSATSNTQPYYYDYSTSGIPLTERGLLYNWQAANNVCPTGWHLPTDAEWTTLEATQTTYNLTGTGWRGDHAGRLAGGSDWHYTTSTPDSTPGLSNYLNVSGFTAIPAGYHYNSYMESKWSAYFWTATSKGSNYAWYRKLYFNNKGVYRLYQNTQYGHSVRCLRNPVPVINTGSVLGVTSTTATCGGEVVDNGGYSVTARGVCWSTSHNPTVADAHTINGTGLGQFTSIIDSLTPGTTYYVRAYATNSEGTAYGEEVSFFTQSAPCPGVPTVTDHEGNVYNTIKIGNQCWMKENLRTTTSPSTGTYLIPATGTNDTYTGKQARWYNNDSTTYAPMNYGLMYNWNAAVDTFNTAYGELSVNTSYSNAVSVTFDGHRRGICPIGWHLPSDAEWSMMEMTVNGSNFYDTTGYRGSHAGKLAGGDNWSSSTTSGAPGDYSNAERNVSGFSAVPAGYCSGSSFYYAGYDATFWSATQYAGSPNGAYFRILDYTSAGVYRDDYTKTNGRSVRCVRDPIPVVNTGSVLGVMSTTATCSGEVVDDGGFNVTAHGVCWSTSHNPTIANAYTNDGTGVGSFTSNLMYLTPGTTYYVRAYATNSEGTSYGEEVSFTTLACPTPNDISASGITTESATINWYGSSDSYLVRYRTPIQVYFKEDFENGLPSTWTTIDQDGDGHNWSSYSNTTVPVHSGTVSVASESYDVNSHTALSPDNWLITPKMDLQGVMKVWLRAQDWEYANERFAIYLSTTGNAVSDFTTTLVGETFANSTYTEYSADLSTYAGQQGYIAIRHFNCRDMLRLVVDDFGLYEDVVSEWQTVTSNTNSASLTGLTPGTPYEVQVQGVCAEYTTDWSDTFRLITNCRPEDQCELTFVLTDSYGDGWNGSAIQVTDAETGALLGYMANENLDGVTGEETQTVTLAVCNGRTVNFEWVEGSWPQETSYTVYDGNGEEIFSGSGGFTGPISYTVSCASPCPAITLPYTENFDGYTTSTTAATGAEPTCWELVQPDVQMTDANRPQLYYKSDYAHSGKYSLLLNYRGVYAMPELSEDVSVKQVKLEMYLRQPKSYYALQVGVWEDNGNFVPVATFNNSGTGLEFVECDFSDYNGNGRRIAFRNISGDNTVRNYSYNYIDDINLTNNCEPITLPYTEDFDSYTTSTTAATGVEPNCWNLVQPDVQMTDANRPQLYYKSSYAHSGAYSLLLNYRGVYAMPELSGETQIPINRVKLEMYVRQPKAYYQLEVGVWNGQMFVPVQRINNSTTEVEKVTVDFSGFEGWGNTIAFRNVLADGYSYNYSYNYIDDITLTEIPEQVCGISELPYTESFDDYTQSTTAETGVQPNCWEVTHEDVALTNATKPQVYYNATYATSGSYTLRMKNRCVYALPELNVNQSVSELTMTFKLRQPKTVYRLQVGVVDAQGNFTSVKTINNSSTGTEEITVDFTNYTGNGRRIAFRNTVSSSSTLEYSVNYIDDITLDITPAACGIFELPYSENFDDYTQSTTAETGVQPRCWEVTHEDVALTNATKPQVYYNATYATSGSYTLRMKNRCVYALPELNVNQSVNELTMTFKLRQPKTVYRLQVGVVDAQGNFTSVKTINNSSTETEDITVDFANYTGNGRRIAFRNTVSSSSTLEYSVNYIDDITLEITPAACGIFELPYSENFDDYTTSTTAETGVQPNCWEVVNEEVALTNATKPQVYYNATYATSGSYTLRMKNRCVYALPELNVDQNVNELTMTFKLRQPKTVYRLQVGVVDAQGNFTSVKTINNSSTETEDITVDFANYTGNGRRIAFRNTVSSSSTLDYSVNYIDDIVLDLTPASCDISNLPYTENFDSYTQSTTAETGVQPNCWEVITEEVALTNATKPQVYYNATYATSGNYTLRMKNRCVYALPELNVNDPVSSLTMTFKLRQPKTVYRLQVGVVDAQGNFTSVKTINNSSTNTEDITVDFANYTGNGRRIAFRNTVSSSSTLEYSVNYIDDIMLDITPAACGIFELPYSENFDDYTASTTAETGVQPRCWEVTHEDVALTNATKPQVYYNATYATSGSYTLRMKNRCVYALPELNVNDPVSSLTMTFSLRQPKAVYRLQVGVVDAQGNFTSVKTINNSSTETEDITVDFANYTGNGRRIAFRNTVSSSSTLEYSVNYIDDIMLDITPAACGIFELPYTENFDDYTQSTTAETGVQPRCWEVVNEDVALTNSTKPQVYYNTTYATSGSYTLRMKNRCVYALPELNVNQSLSELTMTFKLRQPKTVYRLQVGVVDAQDNFTLVKTINNSSTETEDITVDFANYTGNGRRIAFRNTVSSSSTLEYSVNYIDDIVLVRTANNKSGEVTDATAVDALAADRDQVDVVVYPNPTKDVVNVQCTMNNAQCSGIEIVDVYGKIITTVGTRFIASAYSPASAQSPVQINVSGLAAGMYFVRVTTDRGVVTKPFVKR